MKLALAVLALVLAALVSGCSPAVSIRPLYTEDDLKKPVVEPRIEGEWISPDLDKAGTDGELSLKWKIDPPKRPGLSYSVEVRPAKPDPKEGEEVTSYNVRMVPIEDKMFFDADFEEQEQGQHKLNRGDIAGLVPAHLIGRVWVQQDFLRIALFDSKWVNENLPETFRESVDVPDVDISVITGSTGDLRKFVLQNAGNEKALSYVLYLCRPGTDCPVRAAEDALARTPDEQVVVEDAASLFLKRGNYPRAVALRRHAALLAPKDAATHVYLGEALLFARDFAGARKEFTAIPDPTVKKPSACSDIMWSYFLEGNWAEVPQAAARCKEPANSVVNFSPEAVLLSYYSLLRLGRKSEAEAYLAEETAKFTGPLTDHALLLRAQQRMYFAYDKTKEEQPRADFFDGLAAIYGAGWSRELALKSAAEKAPNDSVYGLTARIELERLKPKVKK